MVHRHSMVLKPLGGRLRKQLGQSNARQQQVSASGAAKQRIPEYAQEHLTTGQAHRRIQCSCAQWLDQFAHDCRRQVVAEICHRLIRWAHEAPQTPLQSCDEQRNPVLQGPPLGAQDTKGKCHAWRAGRQCQAGAIRVPQVERRAQQGAVNVYAHQSHQAQTLAVGADQNVLTVVEQTVWAVMTACSASAVACHFEHLHVVACLDSRDGR